MRHSMRVLTFVTTGLLTAMTAMTAMADSSVGTWRVEWGQAWKVRGDLAKGRDLSGAASFGGDKALVISDETRAAQEVSIDRAALSSVAVVRARGAGLVTTASGRGISGRRRMPRAPASRHPEGVSSRSKSVAIPCPHPALAWRTRINWRDLIGAPGG